MKPQIDLSFYLVLDPQLCEPLGMIETARMAAAGGATAVQLRHKQADTRQMVELGRALQQALAGSAATLVINDDVEAAKALNAPALHIGQGDMPVARARALIGPDMLLGLSVETPELSRPVRLIPIWSIISGPGRSLPPPPNRITKRPSALTGWHRSSGSLRCRWSRLAG